MIPEVLHEAGVDISAVHPFPASLSLRSGWVCACEGVHVVPPFQGGCAMKTSLLVCLTVAVVFVTMSTAIANPAMLPNHPGYPMGKAVDPVKGQSLANDPGQMNATGQDALTDAAVFDDRHSKQNLLNNQDNERIIGKPGAGLLPNVQGPNITIDPLVKEATKVNAAP